MTISLSDIAKRFNREWIFRRFSYKFHTGQSYAITGPNGSGKSTLLQVIGGAIAPSTGKIIYSIDDIEKDAESAYQYLSFAAPYLELIEEMTLTELLTFQQKFKPFLNGISQSEMLQHFNLQPAAQKQIRYFSSGMKQRVKLLLAFFADTVCVLLDEPCTNLDEPGVELYHQLIKKYCSGRLVIVSSNEEREYNFCKERINILDFK
ncbi:MAG TPA: ATP-binding cassette domain-containing protein [Flavitalea sp.]|nr:ATP-binding cassette domain-containing protein [Flavitalea sp.]